MNEVWFSFLLKARFPLIFDDIAKVLSSKSVPVSLLEETKDIWCRDYLPVSDGNGGYVQFMYDPWYLKPLKYRDLKTDPVRLHKQLGISPRFSDLVLDGGNLVRHNSTAIMTEVVFKDNPDRTEKEIRKEICFLLNLNKLVIIPKQPNDFTGHADGMVRLLDEKNVLVNDYSGEKKYFRDKLMKSLKNGGLTTIPFVYAMDYNSSNTLSATGTYINFLEVNKTIVFPAFDIPDDDRAEREIKKHYPENDICVINCKPIAEEGGVLNCVGWVKE